MRHGWNLVFFNSPIPAGSVNTINTLSKCHGPPAKTFLLSALLPNWKIKMFSPSSSILTSFIVFHTRSKAALSPSFFIARFSNTFPTKHPARIFSPISFILPLKVTFPLVSPFREIALCPSSGRYWMPNYKGFHSLSCSTNINHILATPFDEEKTEKREQILWL